MCKQSLVSISRILQKILPRFNWDVNTPLTHTPSCEGLCQSLMRSQSVKWEGVNLCLVNWSKCEVGLLLGDYYGSWTEYHPNLSSTSASEYRYISRKRIWLGCHRTFAILSISLQEGRTKSNANIDQMNNDKNIDRSTKELFFNFFTHQPTNTGSQTTFYMFRYHLSIVILWFCIFSPGKPCSSEDDCPEACWSSAGTCGPFLRWTLLSSPCRRTVVF